MPGRARFKSPIIPNIGPILKSLSDISISITKDEVRKFAEQERDLFVRRIKQQDFESFHEIPLSWRTILKKKRYGASLLTMIATEEYINSIKVFDGIVPQRGHVDVVPSRRNKSTIARWTIGIHPSKKAKDLVTRRLRRDMYLQDVARIQEFGSAAAHVPARPHWRPHYQEMVGRAKVLAEEMKKHIMSQFMQRLQRKAPRSRG